MSKKDQILELSAQDVDVSEITERVGTSESYVYKVRSEGNGQAANTNSSASDSSSEDSTPADKNESSESSAARNADSGNDELTFGDDPEPKEYDCGNCETGVPYLEKHCPECGEKLMWSKIEQ